MQVRVLIMGAGFSGLTLAHELRKRNFEVTIVDQAMAVGGLLQTQQTAHQLAETGASGFFLTDNLAKLLQELQVPLLEQLPEASKKYIYRNRLRRFPLGFFETLQFIFKSVPRLVLKTPLHARPQETVHDWALRNFPRAAVQYLIEPFFQGIHAGDLKQMQANLVLEHFFKRTKAKTKRRYVAPQRGMSEFLEILTKRLIKDGVEFQLGRNVSNDSGLADLQREFRCDLTVLATSLKAAENLLPQGSVTRATIGKCKMVGMVKMNIAFDLTTQRLPGFGILIPRDQKLKTLGILANTHIFADRGLSYNESWLIGGALGPEVQIFNQQGLINLVQTERKRILGDAGKIQEVLIARWPQALPQYDHHLAKLHQFIRVDQVSPQPEFKDLFFAGNYLRGIGLSQSYDYNLTLAEHLENLRSQK